MLAYQDGVKGTIQGDISGGQVRVNQVGFGSEFRIESLWVSLERYQGHPSLQIHALRSLTIVPAATLSIQAAISDWSASDLPTKESSFRLEATRSLIGDESFSIALDTDILDDGWGRNRRSPCRKKFMVSRRVTSCVTRAQ